MKPCVFRGLYSVGSPTTVFNIYPLLRLIVLLHTHTNTHNTYIYSTHALKKKSVLHAIPESLFVILSDCS